MAFDIYLTDSYIVVFWVDMLSGEQLLTYWRNAFNSDNWCM